MTDQQFVISCLMRLVADRSNIAKLIERATAFDELIAHRLSRYMASTSNSVVYWDNQFETIFGELNETLPAHTTIGHLSSIVVCDAKPKDFRRTLTDLKEALSIADNGVELVTILVNKSLNEVQLSKLHALRDFYSTIHVLLDDEHILH